MNTDFSRLAAQRAKKVPLASNFEHLLLIATPMCATGNECFHPRINQNAWPTT